MPPSRGLGEPVLAERGDEDFAACAARAVAGVLAMAARVPRRLRHSESNAARLIWATRCLPRPDAVARLILRKMRAHSGVSCDPAKSRSRRSCPFGFKQKRLAGVLAWWVPDSRDVINGLGVTPPEEDSDEAITDAVLQVLEKDPFVNAESIRVQTGNAVVVLSGVVPRAAERDLAENDARYVFGADKVINRLDVRP